MDFDPAHPACFVTPGFRPMAGVPRDVIDPATLEVVGRITEADEDETAYVINAVTAAQASWKRVDAKSRAKILHDL
ncbi:MAG: aldehyde dehydrogenase family protein, partial [Albidovulum sp.]|uniref:aldehyde dehydrogenase family protein n=1 Tax=Albidovulum sp. TaxID=1872424 RepID=UPI003C9814CE